MDPAPEELVGADRPEGARKRTGAGHSTHDDRCLDWLWRALYSADGRHAACPRCRRRRTFHRVQKRLSYSCDSCGWHIHPTAGTIFYRSHMPLGAWFRAVASVAAQPGGFGPSSLRGELDVNPRTASRMIRLIRQGLAGEPGAYSSGLPPDVQRELLVLIAQAAASGPEDCLPEPPHQPLTTAGVTGRTPPGSRIEAFAAHGDPRERILEAAGRAIVARGMGATRIVDIAREAGVSPAIVHYYFATKDAVLLEAARWVERETVAQRDQIVYGPGSALAKLSQFLDAQRVSHQLSWQEIVVYFGLWDHAIRSPRYRAQSTRARQVWKAYWTTILEQGVAEGVFHLAAPLDDVIERIAAFLDGISIQILLGHPWLDERRAADLTYEFVAEQVGVPVTALGATVGEPSDEPRSRPRRPANGRRRPAADTT
jgi:AcrR family transcriptional regulator/transposase-like protein